MTDWQQHYLDTLGNVPAPIASMFDADEAWGEAYTLLRKAVYEERPDGLPTAMKELLYVVLDVALDNLHGAENHLAAAYAAGLTDDQLKEALMITFAMCGIGSWGKTGSHLWTGRRPRA
jgi:alkylhydroperoxidase/carboxymuconolactone decarboxylase family protein YurZ